MIVPLKKHVRKCSNCGQIKEYSEFSSNGNYLRTQCKDCLNIKNRKYHLLERYGVTEEYILDLLLKQDYKCKICHRAIKFDTSRKQSYDKAHFDHNHKTGKARGLVCFNCNLMLGWAGDNVQIFIDAAQYLMDDGKDIE